MGTQIAMAGFPSRSSNVICTKARLKRVLWRHLEQQNIALLKMKVLANFQVRTGLITKSKISHAQNETYFAKKQKVEHRTMETKSAREEELDKND